jgi:hypothetical protein
MNRKPGRRSTASTAPKCDDLKTTCNKESPPLNTPIIRLEEYQNASLAMFLTAHFLFIPCQKLRDNYALFDCLTSEFGIGGVLSAQSEQKTETGRQEKLSI